MVVSLNFPLILASQSPRRKEILQKLSLEFSVVASPYQEPSFSSVSSQVNVLHFVQGVALKKAQMVYDNCLEPSIVIGADTIVLCKGEVFEKPKDKDHAHYMFRQYSGAYHDVLTGVAVCFPDKNPVVFVDTSRVFFRHFDDEEIQFYLDHSHYQDKSGAIEVLGAAARFITRIEGDVQSIMGLPLSSLYEVLSGKSLK